MSKKNQKSKQKSKILFDEDSMNVGGLKFTNFDLKELIKKSGAEGKDFDTPELQKMLDEFATQQSKTIVDSAVKTLPTPTEQSDNEEDADDSTQSIDSPPPVTPHRVWHLESEEPTYYEPRKPDPELQFRPYLTPKFLEKFNRIVEECQFEEAQKEMRKQKVPSPKKPVQSAPPPPKTSFFKKQKTNRFFGGKYVNPNGIDSHFFAVPEIPKPKYRHEDDDDDIEEDCVRERRYPPLDESDLFYYPPVEIAKRLLDTDFRFSFPFYMDITMGLSGIQRRMTWWMTGHDTYTELKEQLQHQFCEGDNYQLFYLNFEGRYMEIHDNFTLKQALVTHGAYPRGMHCSYPSTRAKFLLVASTNTNEDFIFEREKDLIMGGDNEVKSIVRQDYEMADYLPFLIGPEDQFKSVYRKVIEYSPAERNHPYNAYTNPIELMKHCQQPREVEELFQDTRTKRLDKAQIMDALNARRANPYNGMTPDDSAQRDYLIIMEHLRKSKHQTKDMLQEIDGIMKKDLAEWKQKEAERRRVQMQFVHFSNGFSGPHTVQHIPNPALMRAEAPMTLSQMIQNSDYSPAYVSLAQGTDEIPSIISKLKHDSESLQSNVKHLIEERDGYVGRGDDIEIEEIPGSSTTIRIGEHFGSKERGASQESDVYNPAIINIISGLLNPPNKHAETDHVQHHEDRRVKNHLNRVIHHMNQEDDPTAAQIAQGLSWNTSDYEDTPPPPPSVPPPPLEEVDNDTLLLPEELAELGMIPMTMGMMSPFAQLAASQEQQKNLIPLAPGSGISQMDAILAALETQAPDALALSAVVDRKRLDGQTVVQPNIAKFLSRDTVNLAPTTAFVPPIQYTFIPAEESEKTKRKSKKGVGSKKND